MNHRTTLIGLLKVLTGTLGAFLLTLGIDLNSGRVTIDKETAPIAIGAVFLYFFLSGLQAWLTQDRADRPRRRSCNRD